MKELQNCVQCAPAKQWTLSRELEAVVWRAAEIRQGKRLGSDLVILDLEFSQRRHQTLEIAIVKYVSGRVLVEARVKMDKSVPSSLGDPNPLSLIMRIHTKHKYSKLADRHIRNVHEIAHVLRNAGVNQQTIFLVWHMFMDLTMLGDFLQSAGYDILSSNECCVRLIPYIRTNVPVPVGRGNFPARLDVVFPPFSPVMSLSEVSRVAAGRRGISQAAVSGWLVNLASRQLMNRAPKLAHPDLFIYSSGNIVILAITGILALNALPSLIFCQPPSI